MDESSEPKKDPRNNYVKNSYIRNSRIEDSGMVSGKTSAQVQFDFDAIVKGLREFEEERKRGQDARERAKLLRESFAHLQFVEPALLRRLETARFEGSPLGIHVSSYISTDNRILALLRCAQAYCVDVLISSEPLTFETFSPNAFQGLEENPCGEPRSGKVLQAQIVSEEDPESRHKAE